MTALDALAALEARAETLGASAPRRRTRARTVGIRLLFASSRSGAQTIQHDAREVHVGRERLPFFHLSPIARGR
jgi:hypothetical protein